MASNRRAYGPPNPWAALGLQLKFLTDCQAVVAGRLARLSLGGSAAAREGVTMVEEKLVAFAESQVAAALAFPTRGLVGAVVAGAGPYRRAVARNRRRLSG